MKRTGPALLLAAIGLAFGITVYWMVAQRVDRGDTYPPGSSVRVDPLGTRVLYESLAAIPGLQVERNFHTLTPLDADHNTVLFFVSPWPSFSFWDDVNQLAMAGGHVVVALPGAWPHTGVKASTPARKDDGKKPDADKPKDDQPKEEKATPDPRKDEEPKVKELKDVVFDKGFTVKALSRSLAVGVVGEGQFGPLPWFGNSALDISKSALPWTVLHRIHGKPVIIQRQVGRGMITVLADDYALSNEAMARHPPLGLVSALVGPRHHIVFDESLHGALDDPGVAALVHRHRLTGFFVALTLVGLLQFWRHARPPAAFVRVLRDTQQEEPPAHPLRALLRRHVTRAQLVPASLDLYRKDVVRRVPASARHRASKLHHRADVDPVTAWNSIRDTLNHERELSHKR